MDKNLILDEKQQIEIYELEILKDLNAISTIKQEISTKVRQLTDRSEEIFYNRLSELERYEITPENFDPSRIRKSSYYDAIDLAWGIPGALSQPSHKLRPYSLIKRYPDAQSIVPQFDPNDVMGKMLAGTEIRSNEILREFSAQNTKRAFNGDLAYWEGWLSANGYDFESPLTHEHVKMFAIQHAEGLPVEIDKKLVDQKYKQDLGPHKISTIKRRLASLSVALELERLPNPTKDKEFRRLMEKLTKKYSESHRKGRAITRDILFAMLDTCRDGLLDTRDKALILFGWASGGRRRSEIANAALKDLETVGENFIYNLPKSKTDQKSKGKTVPVNGQAAFALNEWIQKSGILDGRIFRSVSKSGKIGEKITDVDINRIVKNRIKKAGYDPKLYSAHSLRSGFITEAGRRGCPLGDAMELSTHRSVSTAMKYYQAGSVTNNSAANMVS